MVCRMSASFTSGRAAVGHANLQKAAARRADAKVERPFIFTRLYGKRPELKTDEKASLGNE